jgi:8-oxo-dGTP diphosphatase
MTAPRRLSDVDWRAWTPQVRATLLFVVRDHQILLIRKKRGLGAGKVNGPGGKLDPGETPRACAIREVQEELGVTPLDPRPCGELSFQFTDGLALHVAVFIAPECDGQAHETDEAVPLWTPLDAIPYDEMWADDRVWLPHALAGRTVRLRAVFDGDQMLDHALELAGEPGRADARRAPTSA